jgi:site-specific DNA recombinase
VAVFDVYIRVSSLGERTEDEATEVYEAQCRAYAHRHGLEIDLVEEDVDTSGSVEVAHRKLESLIQRVEAGTSEGILTPYLDRFGRDTIEGALAYRRIKLAGGRLVCTEDGIDSDRPGDEMVFQIRMVVAEDYLRRIKSNFQDRQKRAAEHGIYLAKAPFGYLRDEESKKLLVNEVEAKVVRFIFARRAQGASLSTLVRDVAAHGYNRSRPGLRAIIRNRAYVGEQIIASERRGQTRVIRDHHAPIVTPAEWEAANAIKNPAPVHTGRSASVLLKGIARCGTCNQLLRISTYGAHHRTLYTCTSSTCTSRAAMTAAKLERAVTYQLDLAIATGEPHVVATIENDDRFERALADVAEAKAALDEYRDNVDLQRALGMTDWAEGLKPRRAALDQARRALSQTRPLEARSYPISQYPQSDQERRQGLIPAAVDLADQRAFYRRVIAEIRLNPRGAEQRIQMRWTGAEEFIAAPLIRSGPYPVPTVVGIERE